MTIIALACIAWPLAFALLIPAVLRRKPAWGVWFSVVPLVPLVALIMASPQVLQGQISELRLPGIAALGGDRILRLDGLGLWMGLLIAGIGVPIFVHAARYLRREPSLGRTLAWLSVFTAAMLGMVLAGDALTLFVAWELTGLASFFLIGLDHQDRAARLAALRALLLTGAGGLCLLGGLTLLATFAGTDDIGAWIADPAAILAHPAHTVAVGLILLGAMTKSAQFPFHGWLPGAMTAPAPVSAFLHSATMVKAGIFIVLRLQPVLDGPFLTWAGFAAGTATALIGLVFALRATDLKILLAWSTVGMLGWMFALASSGSPKATLACLALLTAHALYKAALFLIGGNVDHGCHTRELPRLGGLARTLPGTAIAAALAALSMVGLPPALGFVAKEMTFLAGLGDQLLLLGLSIILSLGMTAVALRVSIDVFGGRLRDPSIHPHEVDTLSVAAPLGLGLVGFAAPFFSEAPARIWAAALASIGHAELAVHADLGHALQLGPALVLSALGLATGWTLHRIVLSQGRNLSTPSILALPGLWEFVASWFLRGARWLEANLQHGRLAVYLTVVISVPVGLAIGATFRDSRLLGHILDFAIAAALILLVIEGAKRILQARTRLGGILLVGIPGLVLALIFARYDAPDIHVAILALLAAAGAVGALKTRSRFVGLLLVGITGFALAMIFATMGAPDLAMTQAFVEVLTVVLLLPLLAHLPSRIHTPPGILLRRLRFALPMALGLLVSSLTLGAMREGSPSRVAGPAGELSLSEGEGRNVVNVILVDFRALDTLGEIIVLVLAALGVAGLLLRNASRETPA